MKPPLEPKHMSAIIDRRRYDTQSSLLIASDDWDGNGFARLERNRFLYRTPDGEYFLATITFRQGGQNHFLYRTPDGECFLVELTPWEGELDTLRPISTEEAIELYEGPLQNHHIPYEEAFSKR